MKIGYFSRALFSFFILTSIFFLTAQTSSAQPQEGCPFTLAKQAEGAGDLEFNFTIADPGGGGENFSLVDGESIDGFAKPGAEATIVEQPTAGWVLYDVDCEGDSGLSISNIDNGISIACIEPTGDRTTCTFINVPAVHNIPTLSEWGMIAAALGLGVVGLFFAIRKRKVRMV